MNETPWTRERLMETSHARDEAEQEAFLIWDLGFGNWGLRKIGCGTAEVPKRFATHLVHPFP
jgi:hypothetical protein